MSKISVSRFSGAILTNLVLTKPFHYKTSTYPFRLMIGRKWPADNKVLIREFADNPAFQKVIISPVVGAAVMEEMDVIKEDQASTEVDITGSTTAGHFEEERNARGSEVCDGDDVSKIRIISEGKVRIPQSTKIFYNPTQEFNRDMRYLFEVFWSFY